MSSEKNDRNKHHCVPSLLNQQILYFTQNLLNRKIRYAWLFNKYFIFKVKLFNYKLKW